MLAVGLLHFCIYFIFILREGLIQVQPTPNRFCNKISLSKLQQRDVSALPSMRVYKLYFFLLFRSLATSFQTESTYFPNPLCAERPEHATETYLLRQSPNDLLTQAISYSTTIGFKIGILTALQAYLALLVLGYRLIQQFYSARSERKCPEENY